MRNRRRPWMGVRFEIVANDRQKSPLVRHKLAASVKTRYLYGMNNRLVNVRLDDRLLARARRLRAEGITLSDLVREAIDRQYEQLMKSSRRRDVEAIMKEIYERYPDPPSFAPRKYDVHDRRGARQVILRKLRRKQK
jgi:DNA relaxase NicK